MCIRYFTRLDDVLGGLFGGVLAIGLTIVGLHTTRSLNPMSDRYELLSVAVETPVRMGNLVTVSVLRRIKQDFHGHYVTTVRRVDADALVCNGGEGVPYRAMTPEQLSADPVALVVTLDWWTAGAKPPCQEEVDRLSPGQFVLTSCVYDDSPGLQNRLWPRSVCKDSNTFEVIP
jgi:hypothetical protein